PLLPEPLRLLSAAKLAAWLMPGKNCRQARGAAAAAGRPALFSFIFPVAADWHADRMGVARSSFSPVSHASSLPPRLRPPPVREPRARRRGRARRRQVADQG